MTTEELKKQAREEECQKTSQCVYDSSDEAKKAITGDSQKDSTTYSGSTVDMECGAGGGFCETRTQQSAQSNQDTQQIIDGVDNSLLIIVGLIIFTIIILLMGILIALNRIAKKN